MKSQTWLRAVPPDDEGRAEASGRVDRGAGQRNTDQVHHDERRTDGQAGRALNGCLVGGEEDHGHEDEGHHHLDAEGAALVQKKVRGRAVAVRTQPLQLAVVGGNPLEDLPQHGGPGDGPGELGHPEAERLADLHPAGGHETQGHGRIDVAARDRSDGVGQAQQDQPEGERGGHHAGRITRSEEFEPEALRSDPDGDEHQDEGAGELGGQFLRVEHLITPWSRRGKCGRSEFCSATRAGRGPSAGQRGGVRRRPSRRRHAGGSPWRPAACGTGRAPDRAPR